MTAQTVAPEPNLFGEVPVGEYGSIAIRVVVLPKKKDKDGAEKAPEQVDPLDLGEDEILPESGSTPVSSYLEAGKGGKQCCVFLVNGQRQDALDNSFIIQQLGFKYLRNRMMIVVDVDGLAPEALGKLMLGNRQEFFKGEVWYAIERELVATLKDDPDLDRLEEEAEEEVSELRAGDEKVKHTLDQLIDSHHERGLHVAAGAGIPGSADSDENLGLQTVNKDGVVSLLPPSEGASADYPVLVSQPASSQVRLRPNQMRELVVKSMPANAWPALAELSLEGDPTVPELQVQEERRGAGVRLRLLFQEPENPDPDQYPIRAEVKVTARFNGIAEPRRLRLQTFIKPDVEPPEPLLNDRPTWIRVSSREPVKIKLTRADTHVRLRWNGKDNLATGPSPQWEFKARLLTEGPQPMFNFSQPSRGRFSLLISPRPEWAVGEEMTFSVVAVDGHGAGLDTKFQAVVVPVEPVQPVEDAPRLVHEDVATGAIRRPPYELKYIERDEWARGTCWGGEEWTECDPGCFQEPTERSPLTLIINSDMAALKNYKQFLTKEKKLAESEIERRINKYTSHVSYHLYQMYQAAKDNPDEEPDAQTRRHSAEIRRMSLTLLKLMEVSR